MSGIGSLGLCNIEPLEYQAYLLVQLFEQHCHLGKVQEVRQINKVPADRQATDRRDLFAKKRIVINVPVDARSFLHRGLLKLKAKSYDEAIEDFNHALRIDQNFAAAYVGRADAYMQKGDMRSACRSYDQAIAALSRHKIELF